MASTADQWPLLPPAGGMSWVRGRLAEVRVAGIVLAALCVRVLALIAQGPNAMDWDGADMIRTAQNLLSGHGYIGIRGAVDAIHAPLYPLLIAGLTFVIHDAERSAVVVTLIVGALFPAVVYAVAKRAFDERIALVAAVIVAVHPVTTWLSLQLLADQLAFVLEFAGIALLLRWLDDQRHGDLVGTGVLFGLAYLARPEAIIDVAVAGAVVLTVRRRAPRHVAMRLSCVLIAFALLSAPYAVFLSNVTGQVSLEGKTPVNYAIGVRIERGMNYVEAADGLGPDLQEDGVELGDGLYFTHPDVPHPSFDDRVRFALRAAPAHVVDIARTLASRHYGTPLFCVFCLIGIASGLRGPRAIASFVLLACALGKFVALLSVAHFWDRYAAPFVPFMAIFGAAGIVVCGSLVVRRWPMLTRPAPRAAVAVLTGLLVLGIIAGSVRELRANVEDPRPLAAAGRWIAANEPSERRIMAVTPLVAYYAGDVWNPLPWSTSAVAARYVRRKDPDLVVLEARDPDRPYLAEWRRNGIPLHAQLVYRSPGDGSRAVAVYRLH